METDIKKVHGVADVISLAGYNLLTSIQTPDTSSFIVVLQPWDERSKEHLTLRGIIKDIDDKMSAYPQAASFPFVPPTIPGLGNASGFAFELQDKGGHTVDELATVADKVVAEARKRPEITAINNTMRTSIPQLQLDVDREQAAVARRRRQRRIQAASGDARRTGRRRVHILQPDVGRDDSGRAGVPRQREQHLVDLRAQLQRRNGTAAVRVTTVRPGSEPISSSVSTRIARSKSSVPTPRDIAPAKRSPRCRRSLRKRFRRATGYGWSGTAYQEVAVGNTQTIIFALLGSARLSRRWPRSTRAG